ncbi:MAG: PAS domain S-box protein [Candidatus Moranbacteria bacterium]|nr:PAS domain S-box protein [Candidatus Moranbacteria bacterium]
MKQEEQEKRLFKLIIEKANDAIFILPASGFFCFVNKQACKLTGYSKSELMSLSFFDVIYKPDQEKVQQRHKQRMQGKKPPDTYEIRVLTKTRSIIPVEIRVSLIKWKGEPASLALVRDITENVRIREALKERVKELHSLYELEKIARSTQDIKRICQALVQEIIPMSMGFPRKVNVEVSIYNHKFKRFKKRYKQAIKAKIKQNKQTVGWIRASYPKENLFVRVIEENLIKNIANRLSAFLERKQANQKLAEVKKQWEATVDNLPQIVCLLDKQARIIRHNRSLLNWKIRKTSKDKNYNGLNFLQVFHPLCKVKKCQLKKFWKLAWQKALNGESNESEINDFSNNLIYSIRIHPLKYVDLIKFKQKKPAVVVIISDITERVRSRRRMLELFKYLGTVNRRISVLLDLAETRAKKKSKIYKLITESAKNLSQASASALFFKKEKQECFSLIQERGLKNIDQVKNCLYIKKIKVLSKLITKQERTQVTDKRTIKAFGWLKNIEHVLILPLKSEKALLGFVLLGFEDSSQLTSRELDFYEVFASQASMILTKIVNNSLLNSNNK